MSNHTTELNFNSIPTSNNISVEDRFLLDTPDGMRIIPIKDIIFQNSNIEAGPIVEGNTQLLNGINNNFFVSASSININTNLKGVIALYYKMRPSDRVETIIKNKINFNIPFNFIGANSLASLYNRDDLILSNDGSILLPPGTYRVRAVAMFCIRNPGRYYKSSGIYVGESYGCNIASTFNQIDSPGRTLLVGDIKYVPARTLEGKTSITTTVDGFFYICKTARVAFKVSTDGNISLGDGSLDNNVIPKPPLLNYAHYNGTTYPAQIILERVSQDDVYDLLGVDFTEE